MNSYRNLKVRLYKDLGDNPGLNTFLEDNFPFEAATDTADIIITDSVDKTHSGKLNILLVNEDSDRCVTISPDIRPEFIVERIQMLAKSYSVSPRAAKISSLQEQNALLSEANKGLVELYNLIENKNSQIQFLKNKLENIINSAGESIVEINTDGTIVFTNIRFEDTTGFNGEQSIGMNFVELITKEDRERFMEILSEIHGARAAEMTTKLMNRNGEYFDIQGYITEIQGDELHYEIIFQDISKRVELERQMKQLEEKAIVAGFSRHLSHNILNALTVAGGFINKIRRETSETDSLKHRWRIVDDKCKLIEEIVTGYNDYTNVISLKHSDYVNLPEFYADLIRSLREKTFEKAFSAFLYNYTDNYEINFTNGYSGSFRAQANKNFLKLGLCYIIKDTIRFFADELPLVYNMSMRVEGGRFIVQVSLPNVDVPEPILETMCQPWNHHMLSQSFDYWGIVIANVIQEKHGGSFHLEKENGGIVITLEY